MSIEQFKADLIVKFIDHNGHYPQQSDLEEIKKLVSFVFGA